MSSHALHNSLLRPPILHILRAAGFHAIRPAVLDTLVDLASRYLTLLAQKTAAHALTSHDEPIATIIDARLALQDVGALRPQMSTMEEQCESEEDMRGMDAFVRWLTGEENREIRRIAGLVPSEGEIVALEASEPREDFFTARLEKNQDIRGPRSAYQLMKELYSLKAEKSVAFELGMQRCTSEGKVFMARRLRWQAQQSSPLKAAPCQRYHLQIDDEMAQLFEIIRLAMLKQWTVDVIPHVKANGASLDTEERFHKQDLHKPLVAATRSSGPELNTVTTN